MKTQLDSFSQYRRLHVELYFLVCGLLYVNPRVLLIRDTLFTTYSSVYVVRLLMSQVQENIDFKCCIQKGLSLEKRRFRFLIRKKKYNIICFNTIITQLVYTANQSIFKYLSKQTQNNHHKLNNHIPIYTLSFILVSFNDLAQAMVIVTLLI